MKSILCFPLVFILLTATATADVVCPDGSSCSDDSTCCEMASSSYGCCPLPNAVCCDDHEHCCPSGFTCASGLCFQQQQQYRLTTINDINKRFNVSDIVCPGGVYFCPDSNTCCPTDTAYSCCPLPDATCCSDGAHCCPTGTTCDVAHQTCNVPIIKIAVSPPAKSTAVVCPGGEFQCPDGNTCCLLLSGNYGCCPLPDAVCCDDKIHCCPTGYTCNAGVCSLPVSGLPDEQTSIFAGSRIEVRAPDEEEGVTDVICPDESSKCPDGNTCCMLSTGHYGCCPLDQATCCSDHIHCCPQGTQCDVTKGSCQFPSIDDDRPVVVPWVRKIPAQRNDQNNDSNNVGSTTDSNHV